MRTDDDADARGPSGVLDSTTGSPRSPQPDGSQLLSALLQCREVRIRTAAARPACSGVTTIVTESGTRYRQWSHPARPATTKVRLCGAQWVSVSYRQRRRETVDALLWRALCELSRRELAGMPKPTPAVVARRKLRDAPSASRFTN